MHGGGGTSFPLLYWGREERKIAKIDVLKSTVLEGNPPPVHQLTPYCDEYVRESVDEQVAPSRDEPALKLASNLTSKLAIGASSIHAKLERARSHRKRAASVSKRHTDGEFTWGEGGSSDSCVSDDADEEAGISSQCAASRATQRRQSREDRLAEVFTKALTAFVPRGPSPAESGTPRTPVYTERVPEARPQPLAAEEPRRKSMPKIKRVQSLPRS